MARQTGVDIEVSKRTEQKKEICCLDWADGELMKQFAVDYQGRIITGSCLMNLFSNAAICEDICVSPDLDFASLSLTSHGHCS